MSQQLLRQVALATACLVGAIFTASSYEGSGRCPCSNTTLCRPVNATNRQEVFAFVTEANKTVWHQFDWTKLTTVVFYDFYDGDLFCYAHEHNVTVAFTARVPKKILKNSTQRHQWVKEQVDYAKSHYLDGVNILFQVPLRSFSTEVRDLGLLVNDAANAMHFTLPGSQVTFNAPWSPTEIAGRRYDLRSIARSCDFLFVMGFDQQSCTLQRPCSARANAGFFKTIRGIKEYLDLGIPPHKLLLGVPWYGYDYPCQSLKKKGTLCLIDRVPFLQCPCSDRVATMKTYGAIQDILIDNRTTIGRLWNNGTLSPYFNYNDSMTDQVHQVQYDDANSLTYKCSYALGAKLRGVGIWIANYLNYSRPEEVAEMWGAVPSRSW